MVDGADICTFPAKKIPEYRRKLGIVFQDFMLFPDKTAYENVAFAMRAVGTPISEIKQRVPALLSLVNMQYAANRYQHELSGGESQRIALARALANNPDIIVADEPTGNVDPNMSNEIMNLLTKVNKLGKTVIIVTHDWDLVERFNMRVIGLKHGRLVDDDAIVREAEPYEFTGNTDSEK
jgi:cell division transport system ATP-binding protein